MLIFSVSLTTSYPQLTFAEFGAFLLGQGLAFEQQQNEYGSEKERDRQAMYHVRRELMNEFVGSEVFPNDANQAVQDYISFILSPFEDFYIHNDLPGGMRMLPVAGPSGVAKTLIARRAVALLVKYGLMRYDRQYFQQGDENAEVDLSLVDRYRITEKRYNDFQYSDEYETRKEIFKEIASIIVFDEASHMPTMEMGELNELINEAIEAYRTANPGADQEILEAIPKPTRPERSEFRDGDVFDESGFNEAMKDYEQQFGQYVLQDILKKAESSATQLTLSVSRDEEIRRVVSRVTTQYFAQQRLRAIEAEIWQALAGGRIIGTELQEVEAKLKQQMAEIIRELADVRARYRKIRQGDPEDDHFIEAQVEKIVGIQNSIEREGEQIAKHNAFQADLRSAGKVLYKLTLKQAQEWSTRSGNFEFRWDEEGYKQMPDPQKYKAWQALVSSILDNPEQFEDNSRSRGFMSRSEEPVKLFEAFGFEEANMMLNPVSSMISGHVSSHRRRIQTLEAELKLINDRSASFDAEVQRLEEEDKKVLKDVISDYADLHDRFEQLIVSAVDSSPAVRKKIKAFYDKLTRKYLEEKYPDYLYQLETIDQVDPDKYRDDVIASDDVKLMFRELIRLNKKKTFNMVEDTIRNGHNDTTVYYSFTTALFLLNELDIEKKVRGRITATRDRNLPVDYDTYEGFYLEELADDSKKRDDSGAFDDNLFDWSARYYKAYFPHLIRDKNVIATRRRLGGQIGPLFITPPNSHQVANLVAQRITTVFDSFYSQIASDLNNLEVGLAIDRNVAMSLVPL
ncbi:MAG: hypothetical protein AAF202_00815, partial [Pseudomonadota bacterium]